MTRHFSDDFNTQQVTGTCQNAFDEKEKEKEMSISMYMYMYICT